MKRIAIFFRWTARLLGLLVIVVLIRNVAGAGIPTLSELTTDQQLLYLAIGIMLIGVVGAWKAEGVGGLIILFGSGVHWFLEGQLPQGYLAVVPLVGCLHLIAWLLDHQPAPSGPRMKQLGKAKARSKRTTKR